jgi:hypothetical protein
MEARFSTIMPLEEPKALVRKRLRDVVDWWNARTDMMLDVVRRADDPDREYFKWSQLVWQEIVMFIQLGKVDADDLDWICARRGFSDLQRKVLEDALRHVGLEWKSRGGEMVDAPVSGTGGVTPVRVRIPPPAQYVEFDAAELELDEMVSAVEDEDDLDAFVADRAEKSPGFPEAVRKAEQKRLSLQEAIDEASKRSGKVAWGTPVVRRTDHRGNPLEVYLPGVPVIHDPAEPVVSLNGWMMLERCEYSILFTEGGILMVFPLELWNTTRIRAGGSPLVLTWNLRSARETRAYMLQQS